MRWRANNRLIRLADFAIGLRQWTRIAATDERWDVRIESYAGPTGTYQHRYFSETNSYSATNWIRVSADCGCKLRTLEARRQVGELYADNSAASSAKLPSGRRVPDCAQPHCSTWLPVARTDAGIAALPRARQRPAALLRSNTQPAVRAPKTPSPRAPPSRSGASRSG